MYLIANEDAVAFARFANRPCISQDMPELARKKHLEKEVRHV